MSVHVEWMSARAVNPIVVPKGDEMPDGQNITEDAALILDSDECVVIEGTYRELRKFAEVAARRLNVDDHEELTRLVHTMRNVASDEHAGDEALAAAYHDALDHALRLLGREDIRG